MSRKAILNIVKLLVAATIVVVLVKANDWDAIRSNLAGMDMTDWGLGLAAMFLAYCLSMVRWRMLMNSVGIEASFFDAFRLGFIGALFNNLVPGLTGGDVIKAVYVAKEQPGKRADAVLTVFVDRGLGIVALALIAAVIIPLDFERYRQAAWGIYGFLALASVGGAVVLSRRIKARIRRLAGLDKSDGKVARLIDRFDRAVSIYRERLDVIGWSLLVGACVHLLIIVAIWLFAGAIAKGNIAALPDGGLGDPQAVATLESLGDMGLSVHCSVVPIIMIISALPIAPAGWGVGDAAFAYFYEAAGTTADLALALSFAYRLTATLLSLLGLPFLLMDRKQVLSVAKEAEGGEELV